LPQLGLSYYTGLVRESLLEGWAPFDVRDYGLDLVQLDLGTRWVTGVRPWTGCCHVAALAERR